MKIALIIVMHPCATLAW